MAIPNKAITLISFFALFLFSIEAQLAPSPSENLVTDVSYISSSPDASPASAPSSSGEDDLTTTLLSYISSSPDASPASAPESSEFGLGGEEALLHELQLPDVSLMGVTDEPTMESQAQMAQAIEKSMQVVEQKIIEFNAILKKRLEDPKTSASTQECINQCDQVYMAAVNDIKSSITALMGGNYQQANIDINAVSTSIDSCEQCFNEMIGEDPELKRFDEWVKGVTTQALGSLEQVSS